MAKIIVVGGSLGGLFAANLLFKAGHDVQILEKVTGSLDGRGAGIVTHPALMQALAKIGIELVDNVGVHVDHRVTLDRSGETIEKIHLSQILTSWSRLYHILKDTFPANRYLSGKNVIGIHQSVHHVSVVCEDGTSYDADLLIASDGLRSNVRGQIAPRIQPEYAGYVAWRGVCDEYVLSKNTQDTLFNYFGFGLPEGEQILGYPVAGNSNNINKGHRRYNFVWYSQATPEKLKELLTDDDGNYHPQGIPPVKVSWRHIAKLRENARSYLAPQWSEILERTGMIFFQPIYDLYSNQVAFDRVGLMGDAAFVARPHVGMGVSKAAEDAMSISDAIEKHGATSKALEMYQSERLGPGQRVIERAKYLGQYMTEQGQEELKNDIHGIAIRVMKETAVDITDLIANK